MQKPPIGWNPVGNHEILVLMADTAAIQRDVEALTNTAERADAISRQLGHQLYHAISLRALGTLDWLKGNHAQGKAHLLEALQIFQTLQTHWQAGRTLYDLAELLAAQCMKQEAIAYYRQAILEFELMQAQPSVERASAALTLILSDTSIPS
jgi:hypothetical protein